MLPALLIQFVKCMVIETFDNQCEPLISCRYFSVLVTGNCNLRCIVY